MEKNYEGFDHAKTILKLIMKEGLVRNGLSNLMIDYQGKTLYANLHRDGKLTYDGKEFSSVSAMSLYMKRQINPSLRHDSGWNTLHTSDGLKTLKELKDHVSTFKDKKQHQKISPKARSTRLKATMKSFISHDAIRSTKASNSISPSFNSVSSSLTSSSMKDLKTSKSIAKMKKKEEKKAFNVTARDIVNVAVAPRPGPNLPTIKYPLPTLAPMPPRLPQIITTNTKININNNAKININANRNINMNTNLNANLNTNINTKLNTNLNTKVNTNLNPSNSTSASVPAPSPVSTLSTTPTSSVPAPATSSSTITPRHASVYRQRRPKTSQSNSSNKASEATEACSVCKQDANPEKILLCDACDGGFHLDCLKPPLRKVPDGHWYCNTCLQQQQQKIGDWLSNLKQLIVSYFSSNKVLESTIEKSSYFSLCELIDSLQIRITSKESQEILTNSTGELFGRFSHLMFPKSFGLLKKRIEVICDFKDDTMSFLGDFWHSLVDTDVVSDLCNKKLLWMFEVYRDVIKGKSEFNSLLTGMIKQRREQLETCEKISKEIASSLHKEKQDRIDTKELVEEKTKSVQDLTVEWKEKQESLKELRRNRKSLFNEVIIQEFTLRFHEYLEDLVDESNDMIKSVLLDQMKHLQKSLSSWKQEEEHYQKMIEQCKEEHLPLWKARKTHVDSSPSNPSLSTLSLPLSLPKSVIHRHIAFYEASITRIRHSRHKVKDGVLLFKNEIMDMLPRSEELEEIVDNIIESCISK